MSLGSRRTIHSNYLCMLESDVEPADLAALYTRGSRTLYATIRKDTPTPSLRHARTPVLDGRASADTNRARLGARRCGAHGSGIAHTTRTCTCLRVRMRTHAPLPARRLRQIEGAHHLLVRQLLSQLCGARDLGDRLVPASDCTLH